MGRHVVWDAAAGDGTAVRVERTESGLHFASAAALKVRLGGLRDGIVCRIAPPQDRDVVQLGVGPTASALCNAIYGPAADTAYLFRGDRLDIAPDVKGARVRGFTISCDGPLTVTTMPNYMRVHRELPWFRPMDRRTFRRAPAGWCSWYFYYLGITEAEVVKNTDWLAANLAKFGCEWVQIDDGWQGRGEGFGSNRDWFVTCKRDFPRGMKYCADYIRSKGFRAGIWCIPFTQSDTALHEKQPRLFVHDEAGGSPGERKVPLDYTWMPAEERRFEWAGRYFIDPTGKEGLAYLKRLFEMICNDWGYDYVKIDAQGGMAAFYDQHRRRLADASLDGPRAYRLGLEQMRAVLGRDRFLLNCGAGWTSCGLCDGIRTGGDVGASWEGMQNGIACTMQWLFLNTLAFYADPDVVCVREPLTLEQARVWATLLGITGQLLMASDKMYELPDERVELLRRIFPVADIHPMELYPLDAQNKPSVFDLKVDLPKVGRWDVVAAFNWSAAEPRTVELSPERLGLAAGQWVCLDAWSGEMLHAGDGKVALTVPPAACRVVAYWPDTGRPQFVGTSRHLTQGADDVERVRWDAERLRLSGISRVVGGDRYVVRVYVPAGYRVLTRGVAMKGRIAELAVTKPENGRVNWRVDFARV